MTYDIASELGKLDVSKHDRLYIDAFDNNKVKVWKASEHEGPIEDIRKICLSLLGKFDLIKVASNIEQEMSEKSCLNEDVFNNLGELKDRISSKANNDPRIDVINRLRNKFCCRETDVQTIFENVKSEWQDLNTGKEFPISFEAINPASFFFKSQGEIRDHIFELANAKNENNDQRILSGKLNELKRVPFVEKFGKEIFDGINLIGQIKSSDGNIDSIFQSIKDDVIARCVSAFINILFGEKLDELGNRYGGNLFSSKEIADLKNDFSRRVGENVNVYEDLEIELEELVKRKFIESILNKKAEDFKKKFGSDIDFDAIKIDDFLSLVSGEDGQIDKISRKWDEKAEDLVKQRNLTIWKEKFSGISGSFDIPPELLKIYNLDEFKEGMDRVVLNINENKAEWKSENAECKSGFEFLRLRHPNLNLQESDLPSDYFMKSSKKGKKSSTEFSIAVGKWVEEKVVASNKKTWDEIRVNYPELGQDPPVGVLKFPHNTFIAKVNKFVWENLLAPSYAKQYPLLQLRSDDLPLEYFNKSDPKGFEVAAQDWVEHRNTNLMILEGHFEKHVDEIKRQLNAKRIQFVPADLRKIFDLAVIGMSKLEHLDFAKVLVGEQTLAVNSSVVKQCISDAVKQWTKK